MKTITFLVVLILVQAPTDLPPNVPADTARLFYELRRVGDEKENLVDSLAKLQRTFTDSANIEVDSADMSRFTRTYKVDAVDGTREIWRFRYQIDGEDTIFQRVDKSKGRWK